MSDVPAAPARATAPVVAAVSALAFAILFGYGLVRSPIESLFLERHGSSELPALWILVAVVVGLVVSLYSRFAARIDLGRLLFGCALASAAGLAATAAMAAAHVPGSAYALYVWKDVHVVVLIEILWTIANSTLHLRAARWVYGFFCVAGSAGDFAGNRVAGAIALGPGTEAAVWSALPVFVLVALAGLVGQRWLREPPPAPERRPLSLDLLRKSSSVALLVALVATVQIAITLVDFAFQATLEISYPDVDQRTHAGNEIYSLISIASLVLQLCAGLLFGFLGLGRVLLAVPMVLGGAVVAFLAAPGVSAMAGAKLASKSLDYSLFRAGKEMLYLPLSYREKTEGKALVDMFGYRVAKGGASLILFGIGTTALAASGAALVAIAMWLGLTAALVRRHRAYSAETAGDDSIS